MILRGFLSLTILGDLAQSIYLYRGLTDWEALREGVFSAVRC